MIIPYQSLSDDTLNNLIKEYVLREGTDYGDHEKSLQHKIEDVKRQLSNNSAVIVYSELHETVNILPKKEFEQSVEFDQPSQ